MFYYAMIPNCTLNSNLIPGYNFQMLSVIRTLSFRKLRLIIIFFLFWRLQTQNQFATLFSPQFNPHVLSLNGEMNHGLAQRNFLSLTTSRSCDSRIESRKVTSPCLIGYSHSLLSLLVCCCFSGCYWLGVNVPASGRHAAVSSLIGWSHGFFRGSCSETTPWNTSLVYTVTIIVYHYWGPITSWLTAPWTGQWKNMSSLATLRSDRMT